MIAPRHEIDAGAITAIVLILWLLLSGCDRSESVDERSGARAEAASPQHYLRDVVRPVMWNATPAPKPAALLPEGASCVTPECHANFATARHVHGPVAEQACNTCHADETGVHTFPLKREGDATCTFCHSVSGTAEHQHKALEQGCTSCHQPHVSSAKYLLKTDTVERLCATCHDVPLKRHAHEPFAKGDCGACHLAHQSSSAMLLRGGDGPEHCLTCHSSIREKLATATLVHSPAQKDCLKCHDAHASEFEYQLTSDYQKLCYQCHRGVRSLVRQASVTHAAMDDAKSCSNCHESHASREPRLLRARTDAICLSCHERSVKTADGRAIASMAPVLRDSLFLHGPIASGNCAACHKAHGTDHASLLTKPAPRSFYAAFELSKYELCFSCHEPQLVLSETTDSLTNFRDGERNLHYLHVNREVKGRTCRTCHETHGSNLPNHLASAVPFEGSSWSMPIGFNPAPDGGSCTPGCHDTKTYSRSTTRGEP